jgi:prophage maintenance system killer protein
LRALGDAELAGINKAVGGTGTVRSDAVMRALQAYVYGRGFGRDLHPTLADKLAALIFGIVQLRPFELGNERTAVAAAAILARVNGQRIVWLSTSEAATFCRAVATGHPPHSYIATRIAARLRPL